VATLSASPRKVTSTRRRSSCAELSLLFSTRATAHPGAVDSGRAERRGAATGGDARLISALAPAWSCLSLRRRFGVVRPDEPRDPALPTSAFMAPGTLIWSPANRRFFSSTPFGVVGRGTGSVRIDVETGTEAVRSWATFSFQVTPDANSSQWAQSVPQGGLRSILLTAENGWYTNARVTDSLNGKWGTSSRRGSTIWSCQRVGSSPRARHGRGLSGIPVRCRSYPHLPPGTFDKMRRMA